MREQKKAIQQAKLAKKENSKRFMEHFRPLMFAVLLWFITVSVLHLPGINEDVMRIFVGFTLESAILFGKLLFISVESHAYPNITVSGYTMQVIMECTAYNFYIFVIYLSLFSPVKWKQKLWTLVIFLSAVFVVNNLRFVTMGFVGNYSEQLFHIIHDYLWNILFGFMVFIIWTWRYKVDFDHPDNHQVD
jgi:exosortase/archaeosortase family protein